MPLDRSGLLGLLEAVDDELTRKIKLVAAGGTAMTLLNLKPSTVDIDFAGPDGDIAEFNRVQKSCQSEKARVTQLILAIHFFVVSNIKQQDDHLFVDYLINKPERSAKFIIVRSILLAALESAKLSRVVRTGQSLDSFTILLLLPVS
jgi:hypothetical protein